MSDHDQPQSGDNAGGRGQLAPDIPTMRAAEVAMSRRLNDSGSLAADIALRLQIVPARDEPAGLAIVEIPDRRPPIRLLGDVVPRLEQLSAKHGVSTETLVDAVLVEWLNRQDRHVS